MYFLQIQAGAAHLLPRWPGLIVLGAAAYRCRLKS